jgi:hypothetical protein
MLTFASKKNISQLDLEITHDYASIIIPWALAAKIAAPALLRTPLSLRCSVALCICLAILRIPSMLRISSARKVIDPIRLKS